MMMMVMWEAEHDQQLCTTVLKGSSPKILEERKEKSSGFSTRLPLFFEKRSLCRCNTLRFSGQAPCFRLHPCSRRLRACDHDCMKLLYNGEDVLRVYFARRPVGRPELDRCRAALVLSSVEADLRRGSALMAGVARRRL